jgi:ADP-ribosylglycohydrolase
MIPELRARLSLDGLSIGDAFGERFFGARHTVGPRIARRQLPIGPWPYTDDTEMAISIVEVLQQYGIVDQDALAERFARRMDDMRGYGAGTFRLLCGVREGQPWRRLATDGFNGMGSFGNGAAMRVAPLGAYFADRDLGFIAEQARLSAEVTHMHREGIAGAVAVAIAAALTWRSRGQATALGTQWIEAVRDLTPAGATRDGIQKALALSEQASVIDAAQVLGNGSGVTAPDTVPLCLWIASRWSSDLVEALWQTVSALGDRDTTCAIVGGIVSLRSGAEGIPLDWLQRRESLPDCVHRA